MPSPDFSQTPYKRAVAYLMNFEHEKALAEFTEAIRLEPDSPNPYIGRAMTHRRMGNEAAARQDDEKARELGGPERNAWERLCNRSRRRWGTDFADPRWKQEDPLSRDAVLLDLLAAQIHNGGLRQWIANGYGEWIEDVIAAARQIGTAATGQVAAMLADLAQLLSSGSLTRDSWTEDDLEEPVEMLGDDETLQAFWDLEDRYYRVQVQFVKDVEQWFEKQLAAVS
jgi:hypothetical protein